MYTNPICNFSNDILSIYAHDILHNFSNISVPEVILKSCEKENTLLGINTRFDSHFSIKKQTIFELFVINPHQKTEEFTAIIPDTTPSPCP